jgi:hypothetical protein
VVAAVADGVADTVDGWVSEYNTTRPHQSLSMANPAERFSTTASDAERDRLPLRLPAAILAAVPPPPASEPGTGHAPASISAGPAPCASRSRPAAAG